MRKKRFIIIGIFGILTAVPAGWGAYCYFSQNHPAALSERICGQYTGQAEIDSDDLEKVCQHIMKKDFAELMPEDAFLLRLWAERAFGRKEFPQALAAFQKADQVYQRWEKERAVLYEKTALAAAAEKDDKKALEKLQLAIRKYKSLNMPEAVLRSEEQLLLLKRKSEKK